MFRNMYLKNKKYSKCVDLEFNISSYKLNK